VNPRPIIRCLIATLAIALCAPPAHAVIAIKAPVALNYQTSVLVLRATITSADPARRLIVANVTSVLKGTLAGTHITLQLREPAALFAQVAPGQPLVILQGARPVGSNTAVHLADTWLLAASRAGLDAPHWDIVGPHTDDNRKGFPGTTAALGQLLTDIAKATGNILDRVDVVSFAGGAVELTRAPIENLTSLASGDFDGDGHADLLAVSGDRTLLLRGEGRMFAAAPLQWKLEAGGRHIAVGDLNGDGRADVVIDRRIFFNGADGWRVGPTLALPPPTEMLALGLADLDGDGRMDVLALGRDGQLQGALQPRQAEEPWIQRPARRLETAKATDAAPLAAAIGDWYADGTVGVLLVRAHDVELVELEGAQRRADFQRLTGDALELYDPRRQGLAGARLAPLDFNGDGRLDLMILTDSGGLLLVNRGYGCFFAVRDPIGAGLAPGQSLPVTLAQVAAVTRVRRADGGSDDLVLAHADGRLIAVRNAGHGGK